MKSSAVEGVEDLIEKMTDMNIETENDEKAVMDDHENEIEMKKECHANIISFFAHKGGVSKTTNVHHLGYMLAQQFGKKVLLVDADPQQNLTQTCCKTAKNDANWRDDIERGTIYTALESLHYGMKDKNKYILPAKCVNIQKKRMNNNGGQLWLLPGCLDLGKLEAQITFAHNICNPSVFPLFNDIAGGFRHLFLSTCMEYDIDYCLIDMGPSIGEMNKSLFWASDYFLIPCSPDSYCKTTMKTMERTLPQWYQQQKQLSKITQDMLLNVKPNPPKFLGILMGLFNVTGKNKAPIKDSQLWMDVIKQTVKHNLVPTLKKCNMVHDKAPNDFTLAEIPHFLSLMPIAQKSFVPVFDIPETGYYTQDEEGNIKNLSKSEIARHCERSKYFEEKYKQLAQCFIDMLESQNESAPVCNKMECE